MKDAATRLRYLAHRQERRQRAVLKKQRAVLERQDALIRRIVAHQAASRHQIERMRREMAHIHAGISAGQGETP